MAPAVPHRTTRRCHSRGTLRAARPMTIALSPARTRSITIIVASAENHAGAKSSGVMGNGTRMPPHTDSKSGRRCHNIYFTAAFRHRIVVGTADTTHRRSNAHLRAALAERDADVGWMVGAFVMIRLHTCESMRPDDHRHDTQET